MIEQLFKQEFVRRRMAANHLGIILDAFAVDLRQRGYAPSGIRHHVLVAEHFGNWLRQQHVSLRCLSTFHVDQFLRDHLPRCRCVTPAPKRWFRCHAALAQLVEFLRHQKKIRPIKTRTVPQGPTDRLLAAYDLHQDRVCGLSVETRRGQRSVARRFLKWRFGRQRPQLPQLQAKDIARFVGEQASQVGIVGLRHIVGHLRSFLRFLEFSGRVRAGLAKTVPQPAGPPLPPPPRFLKREERRKFLNSYSRSSAIGQRDYAIALCLSELALRGAEVVSLTLDDLDWSAMTLRIVHTKQRRQRLLPLPENVAQAILNYLKQGRPPTRSRTLFVHHKPPVGSALSTQAVRKQMRNAFRRCGIKASGTHVLRHTWATWAHRDGAGLKLIADLLGHRSLGTTARYAHVHVEELRQVALPWPKFQK